MLRLVRLRSFDTGNEEGRSRERYRRAGMTAVAAGGARLVGIATAVVTVPLTLNYLGLERYGLWVTISSVSLMLGFADLGIGNGVLNMVSEASGRNDRDLARRVVSSGLILLSAVGVLMVLCFGLLYAFVPWAHVYNVDSADAVREAGPATAVFVLVWALNIPLGIVQRVQLGYQRGFVNYVWQALGSVLALAGALAVIKLELGLPWLVLALTGGPLVSVVLNWAVEFGWQRPWLRPAWAWFSRSVARRIINLGLLFFVIQLSMTFSYFSDNIVIAQVLGSAAVPEFAIPARMFGFIGILVGLAMTPLWPAYGEAFSRGDYSWVERTLARSLVLTLVLTAAPAALLFVMGRPLLHVWVGEQLDASLWLLGGLAVWTVLGAAGATLAVCLNGLGALRFQTVCAVIMALASLALKIVFVGKYGVAGVPWAVAIAYTTTIAVPMAVYVPRLMRQLADVRARDSEIP